MTNAVRDWTVAADHPIAGLVPESNRAFAGPPSATLAVCTCCDLSEAARRSLRIRPARNITRAELEDWFGSAAENPIRGGGGPPPAAPAERGAGYRRQSSHRTRSVSEAKPCRGAGCGLWCNGSCSMGSRAGTSPKPPGPNRLVQANWRLDDLEAQIPALPEAARVARLWQGQDRLWAGLVLANRARPPSYLKSPALRERLYGIILS